MQEFNHNNLKIDDCWNRIGVWSHAATRCPKLEENVHCRNCSVFAAAAHKIFEGRALPDNYLEEWRRHFAQALPERRVTEHSSVLMFRVGDEMLSLPIGIVDEICQPEMIHRLPHYASVVLRGIVNIHGQLRLCFSMSELLGIEASKLEMVGKRRVFPRMLVIRRNESRFALLVDEVFGSHRYIKEDILPVPPSLARVLAKFMRGIYRDGEKSVGLINEELMFQAMEKSLK